MARNVADQLWDMLVNAGVKRCYGIVGDALNPVIDALRRNGKIEFIHVRHEEYGVFAAVAEAYFTGAPVVVCGTAGPGVVHLFNGLMDARKEGAPVIAIAGCVALHRTFDQPGSGGADHRHGNTHSRDGERTHGHFNSR